METEQACPLRERARSQQESAPEHTEVQRAAGSSVEEDRQHQVEAEPCQGAVEQIADPVGAALGLAEGSQVAAVEKLQALDVALETLAVIVSDPDIGRKGPGASAVQASAVGRASAVQVVAAAFR